MRLIEVHKHFWGPEAINYFGAYNQVLNEQLKFQVEVKENKVAVVFFPVQVHGPLIIP